MQEIIVRIETKVLAAGKFLGTIAANWEQAQARYDKGYQLLMLMADGVSLGKLAAGTVAKFREIYPDR